MEFICCKKFKLMIKSYTLFFDSGCSDMVARHESIVRLGDRAKQEIKGPISLGGVDNLKTESKHGVYQIRLPLTNGRDAVLAGVCLDNNYQYISAISTERENAFESTGRDVNSLPKLPASI